MQTDGRQANAFSSELHMQVEMQMPRGIEGQILLVMVNPSSSGWRSGEGEDNGLFVWGLLHRMLVNEPDGKSLSLASPPRHSMLPL